MPAFEPRASLSHSSAEPGTFLQSVRNAIDGDLWVVGGFVRDLILVRRPYDLDLAVRDDARGKAAALASAIGGHPFVLDEDRGTYRVALPQGSPMATVDLSVLRGGTIEADLRERDFTANAMAFELGDEGPGALVDPFGGEGDTRAGIVRMVSPQVLADDPLRLLRAARFATELGFEVEPATAAEVRRLAPRLTEAAPERQRDEFARILASPRSADGVRLMDALGLLQVLIPELDPARGCEQPGDFHFYDVFDHCVEALRVADWMLSAEEPASAEVVPMRRALWDGLAFFPLRDYLDEAAGGLSRLVLTKLGTLLHDIAKPQTLSRGEDGRIHFYGHSEQGAEVGRAVCARLRLGNKETHFVKTLIEEHLRPPQLSQSGHPTDRAIFKFFRDLGDAAPACLLLSMADAASAHGPAIQHSRWERRVAYIGYVLERGTSQAKTLGGRHFVSGDTLIRALELEPGPEVGRLLTALDEARATGVIATEEEAIQMARELRETWRRERRETEVA